MLMNFFTQAGKFFYQTVRKFLLFPQLGRYFYFLYPQLRPDFHNILPVNLPGENIQRGFFYFVMIRSDDSLDNIIPQPESCLDNQFVFVFRYRINGKHYPGYF